jgi:putative ABC transport system permease protein
MTYHWKTLLAVFSGAMISTSVLTGALMLGDSLRFSLEYINLNRLGRIEYALASNGVFFKADLADRIKQHSNLFASSVLATNGIAVIGGGKKRINQVRIFGVGDEFWKLRIDEEPSISIPRGAAIINQQFAKKSGLKKGDEFIIRVETPSFMPADTVLIQKNGGAAARLRLRVHEIIPDTQLGNFSLDASQLPPMNVFMSLSELSLMIDMPDRANLILAKTTGKDANDKPAAEDSMLKRSLTLDDLGLDLRELAGLKVYELKSKQLFFSPLLSRTALESGKNSVPVFSYFINEFSYGGHQTPYSFIAGLDQPMLPVDLGEDEIIINQWLAEDLNVEAGQRINLRYYVIGPMRTLGEEKISLRVKKIVPIAGFARDMDLMPDFPGLSQKETCNDWDPGFPVDLTKVRIKDEEYWRDHKGTPKAFVSFITAQRLWSNKYGNLTAVRYPIPDNSSTDISKTILRSLDPKDVGLAFEAVRENALLAAKGAVDFGQLFLGLSFFIIISAMLLLSVFFSLNMEQRRPDMAILLSLGFKPSAIRKLFLQEGALIAFTGSLTGIFAGILYLYSVVFLLETLWQGAVGNTVLKIKITPSTLAIGFAISILLSMASMWFVAKRQLKSTAATLLSEGGGLPGVPRGNSRFTVVVFWLSLAGIIIVFLCAIKIKGKDLASMFFAAGFLLLISSLTLSNLLLGKASQGMKQRFDNVSLIVQNLMRRRGRNLIVAALMAVGIFMVYSVGINRHGPYSDQNSPQSGTGGFQFYCESTLPIVYDLNTQKGKSSYGLDGKVFKELKFVQLRMKSGDDASCLNLNRVRNPALLGVDPTAFGERKAFRFVKTSNKTSADNAWESLNTKIDDNTIAGIADQSTILWGLGKSVGDTLDYIDESGKPFKVKLIAGLGNSVFQGRILISGKYLEKLYPSVGGTRVLLVNAPSPSVKLLQRELSEKFEDIGLDVMPASERLADFNKVENTYLDIFLMLGALGFIIGTAGLGAMTMKNIMERKKEFAVMQAVGFSKKRIMHIILLEHSALVGAGLACGLISAFIAVTPSLLEQGAGIPWLTLFLISAIILANVVLWVGLSLKLAMPLNLVQELKNK